MDFLTATKHHATVARASRASEPRAAFLWNALRGMEPPPGSYAEAVQDTLPEEHVTMIAGDDVACAYAFDCHWTRTAPAGAPSELRSAAREAWKGFTERASSVQEVTRGLGCDDSAAWRCTMDPAISGADVELVKRVARLAGRMYAALKGASASRVPGVSGEICSVTQGDSVARLLPAELALLTDPGLEILPMARLQERRALQYDVRGQSKRSRGPLVLAIDESGSMKSGNGDRNVWAKAAAVALARVAMDERRPVSVVHYSTSCTVSSIKPGDGAGLVAMVRHFLHGGTAIGLALTRAVAEVKALAAKGSRGADVVLVTDGVDDDQAAMDEALTEADTFGTRLWTVAIECDVDEDSPIRKRAVSYVRLGAGDLDRADSAISLSAAAQ